MISRYFTEIPRAFTLSLFKTMSSCIFKYRMNENEAMKILNLSDGFHQEELASNYKKFYQANSGKKGSPYLQQKIKNAYKYLQSKLM